MPQDIRCLTKQNADWAKCQIVNSLQRWAIGFGLDEEQTKELVNHVCAIAIQYSYNIGEDTEISALEILQERLLERISDENHHVLPVLFSLAVRYAQIDALEIV